METAHHLLAAANEKAPELAGMAVKYASQNPVVAAGGLVAAGGFAVFTAPALATAPLYSALGAAPPIAKGGLFAAYQSSVGTYAAGGLAATVQSAAARGYGVAVVNGAASAGGAAVAAVGGVVAYLAGKS